MNIEMWKNIALILGVDQLRELGVDSTALINISEFCNDIKKHDLVELRSTFHKLLKEHQQIVEISVIDSINVPFMFRKKVGKTPLPMGNVSASHSIAVSATYEVRRLIVTETNDYSLVYEDLKSHYELFKKLRETFPPEAEYTFMKKVAFSFLFGYYQLPCRMEDSLSNICLHSGELDWVSFVAEAAVDVFRNENLPLLDWLVSVCETNFCPPEREPVHGNCFDSL